MITLILGHKGSGKTKKLMAMCNAAVEQSKGCLLYTSPSPRDNV